MIVSIIGTRPQYIKLKPFYDHCKRNDIDHFIIDTQQHYSPNVSSDLIKELGITINFAIKPIYGADESGFIRHTVARIVEILSTLKSVSFVLVYGDTNSSLAAALACKYLGVKFGHVEAGVRCGNVNVPEELNRISIDAMCDIAFPTSIHDTHGFDRFRVIGDLEYEYLNELNPSVSSGEFMIMTIHRQENMSKKRVQEIFDFISDIPMFIWLRGHHRLLNQSWFSELSKPDNLTITGAIGYTQMIEDLSQCRAIISDSGSVPKLAPFFGKPCLILRNETGWKDVVDFGFARLNDLSHDCINWLCNSNHKRMKELYFAESPASEIIIETINAEI